MEDSETTSERPIYDARVVANFIVHYYLQRSEPITQLRLYKLLYFAHGLSLSERDRPLVWNSFEVWKDGPVIKVVRDNYARKKSAPIDYFCSMFDFREGREIELPRHLRENDEGFVSAVIEAYRKFSARQLSLMTHTTGSPWDVIWNAREPVGRFGLRLKDHEILADFKDLVDNEEVGY